MKAREIIPDWPRGRSTTVSLANSRWSAPKFWIEYECRRPLFRWFGDVGALIDIASVAKLRMEDWSAEKAYHEEQQRMVNKFIEMGKPLKIGQAVYTSYILPDDALLQDGELVIRLQERGARMK